MPQEQARGHSSVGAAKRLAGLLKALPGLFLLALVCYGSYVLDTYSRPRGTLQKVASTFTLGLGMLCAISAVLGLVWGLAQLVRDAEREGWLGRLLAVPITFGALACLGYSASTWWVAGPGRLPTWGLFFIAGVVLSSFLHRREL